MIVDRDPRLRRSNLCGKTVGLLHNFETISYIIHKDLVTWCSAEICICFDVQEHEGSAWELLARLMARRFHAKGSFSTAHTSKLKMAGKNSSSLFKDKKVKPNTKPRARTATFDPGLHHFQAFRPLDKDDDVS